jgi:hypothetical protein
VASLGPGERVEFSSRFIAPPVETYRLSVTFAPLPGEATQGGETLLEAATVEGQTTSAPDSDPPAAPVQPKPDGTSYQEPGWNGGDGGEAGVTPKPEPVSGEAGHN